MMKVVLVFCWVLLVKASVGTTNQQRPSIDCCASLTQYKTLYTPLKTQYQECKIESGNLKNEVGTLKEVLSSTISDIKVAPQKIEPPTPGKLELVRKNIIDKAQRVKFNDFQIPGDDFKFALRKQRSIGGPCTQNHDVILASIGGLDAILIGAMNTEFLSYTDSLGDIDSNLIHSCAECRYQITIPGYIPEVHHHVICPKETKPYCMGGVGECAKLEVATLIYNPTNTAQPTRYITLNKGCSCQQYKVWNILGDGN
ncbi:uncharacterized protein [Clytia hemisphaerica]|uniref:Cnidarian restricted protein n=1 Tax=Clytia hemisphaerica TaxID=252671 RepID=A0A7M5UZ01_9CNID